MKIVFKSCRSVFCWYTTHFWSFGKTSLPQILFKMLFESCFFVCSFCLMRIVFWHTKNASNFSPIAKITRLNFCVCLCSVLIHLIAIRSRAKRNNNVVPLSSTALLETFELVKLFIECVSRRTLKGMKYISMISFYAIIRCELSLSFMLNGFLLKRRRRSLWKEVLHVCIILWGFKFLKKTFFCVPCAFVATNMRLCSRKCR